MLFLFLLAFLVPAHAETIPFELTPIEMDGGYIHLSCGFRGVSEKCMFDSGSDSSFISINEQTKDLSKIRDLVFGGAGGARKTCDVVLLEDFSVGPTHLFNFEAVRCEGHPALVGINAFAKTQFLLNFASKKIETRLAAPTSALNPLEVLEQGHLRLKVSLGSEQVDAIWDTGAGITVADERFVQKHPENFTFMETGGGSDSTGAKVLMKVYKMTGLEIQGFRVPESFVLSMSFLPLQQYFGQNTHLILGPNHMKNFNWFMDIPGKKWSIEPIR